MGAIAKWIKENNGFFNERWRGWEDNWETSNSLFGNYLNLGYGGTDQGACFCIAGFNHIDAYGNGNKDLSASNVVGANLICYNDVFDNHAEWVTMRTFTVFGGNVMISHGARNTVMSGIGVGGSNYAEVCGGNSDITLIMVIGDNSAHVFGDGNTVITGINFIGVNELLKVGNGNNVMTAFNTFGFNVLTHIGDGSNIMTAINLFGINSLVSIGHGLNVMNAFNTFGLNFLLRTGDGDNFMLAATFFGVNALTQVGNGLNVMTAFNTAGANVLTALGDGTNVMTAINVFGVNALLKIGAGDSYMTAATLIGGNILTKLGDGINVMTAINTNGLNSLVNVGRGLNVMTAINLMGVNFLLKVGDGDSYMTAAIFLGDNTLIKIGDGINVMTAINTAGLNSLVNTGNGLNVMTAFNNAGANILLKIGDGLSVMTGWNLYGVNAMTRTGHGVNIMTAGNLYGVNVLTRIGNDLNVMTAFNQYGLNALTTVGDGVNIMTAFNQYGVNVLTRVGNDLNVMTGVNQYGVNALTRVGNGVNIMTAGNQRGVNVLTRVGDDLNVMTAVNEDGLNVLTSVGNGTSVMTAANNRGGNLLTRVGDGLTVMTALIKEAGLNAMTSVGDGIRVQIGLSLTEANDAMSTNLIINVRNHDEGKANWRDGVINAEIAISSKTNIIANYGAFHRGDAADLIVAFSRSSNFEPKIDFNKLGTSVSAAFNKNHDAITKKLDPSTYSVKSPFEGLFGDKTTTENNRPNFWDAVPDNKKRFVEGANEWKFDSSGYVNSGLKNFFGINNKYTDLLSRDSLTQAAQSLKNTNLIMAGYGSDVVIAYAERNIILADSWASFIDLDIRMLQGGAEGNTLFNSNQLMEAFGQATNLGHVRDLAKFSDMALPFMNFAKYAGTAPEIANYRYNEETSQFEYIRDSGRHNGEPDTSPITTDDDIKNFATAKMSLRWDTAIYPQMVQQLENAVMLPVLQSRYADTALSENRSHAYTSEIGNLADMLGLDLKHFSNNPFGSRGGQSQINDSFFLPDSQLNSFISWLPFLDADFTKLFSPSNKDNFQASIDSLSKKYSSIFGNDAKGVSAAARLLSANSDVVLSVGNVNVVFGGPGDDLSVAIGSQNFIFGGNGDDKLFGFGDYTQLYGGDGQDLMVAIGDDCVLSGGNGNDIMLCAANSAQIDGGIGDDILIGIGAKTTLLGRAGNDVMIGLGGGNTFSPGSGTNLVIGGGEKNTYILQGGYDFFINFGASNVVYSVGLNSLLLNPQGDDAFYYGGTGHSVFLTSNVNERSVTSIKNCSYFGGTGDEFFELGGSDTNYEGGQGADVFAFTKDCANVFVRDFKKSDNDALMISGQFSRESLVFFKVGAHLYLLSGNYKDGTTDAASFKVSTAVIDGWFENENFQSSVYFGVQAQLSSDSTSLTLTGNTLSTDYIDAHAIEGKTLANLQAFAKSTNPTATQAEFARLSNTFWSGYDSAQFQASDITPNWMHDLTADQNKNIQQSCFAL